jgi:hypothetical protein
VRAVRFGICKFGRRPDIIIIGHGGDASKLLWVSAGVELAFCWLPQARTLLSLKIFERSVTCNLQASGE